MKMKEICRLTGLTERTVRFWAEQGLIQPETYDLNERVYFNFGQADVEALRTVAALRRTGFSVAQILVMQRNPAVIGDTVAALRAELTEQRAESARCAEALQGAADCTDLAALAACLRDYSQRQPLPEAAPNFGRFDAVSPEEKRRAYQAFQESSGRRQRRRTRWLCLLAALALVLLSVEGTLLAVGRPPHREPEPAPGWTERLQGTYDGTVRFSIAGQASLVYSGLDGANGRMTQVYMMGEGELALAWRQLAVAEAELMTAAWAETEPPQPGRWALDPGEGAAVAASYLWDGTGDAVYACYAQCPGLDGEELLAALAARQVSAYVADD